MKPSRIQAIEHVNLEASPEAVEDIRWFYGEVAGLEEVQCDEEESTRLCFKSARLELRISLVGKPHIEPISRRLTLAVPSLNEAAERLAERRVPFVRFSGFRFTDRRVEVHDPAGHLVVLKREWPTFT